MRQRRRAFAVFVLLWCWIALPSAQTTAYAVQRVVDGDTIVLATIGTVRLIGVDTPETVDPRKPVQHFGKEASAFLHSLLDEQSVRLEYDEQRLDKYRRTLAYVYLLDGTFVNLEIVRQGYGHAYLDYPFQRMELFRAAEREAREVGRALWGDAPAAAQSPSAAEPVRVWVNTASKVYHCPGTRYYGSTARGAYMTETAAQADGHRPAAGRTCGPVVPVASNSVPNELAPSRAVVASPTTAATSEGVKVWVNTSSKVYHCPGTRYYGATARGEYMAEGDAQRGGHRPAAGRTCGPLVSTTSPAPAITPDTRVAPPARQSVSGNPGARVWVNTSSHVYHCPGTRYYGTTKNGTYMLQQDAQTAGHRPAAGRYCS